MDDRPTSSRILFGSCNSQHIEPVLWPAMVQRNASAFVWGGDAVYGDDFFPTSSMWEQAQPRVATPTILKQLYRELLDEPGYLAFRTTHRPGHVSGMPVLGVYDDHDYGINNGDALYPYRNESAQLYLEFLENSSKGSSIEFSVMKKRVAQGDGLYGVKVFDFYRPAGKEILSDEEAALEPTLRRTEVESPPPLQLSDRSVAVFLLDCRSNKTPWKTGHPERFYVDYDADFLGEKQWQWLEGALAASTASVNLIVQGLQVNADRSFDGNKVEDWSRFPMAQHRLYQAILKSGASAPILVSGDVHMAEISRKDCQPVDLSSSSKQTLLEVTSSGMTHSWGSQLCARPQMSIFCQSKLFQMALTTGMHFAHINGAWTDVLDVRGPPSEAGAKRRVQYALDRNYGEFEFDWIRREVIVRILGEKVSAPPLLSTTWSFDELSGKTPLQETGKIKLSDYQTIYQDLSRHGAQQSDWICVNHRGRVSLPLKVFGFIAPISVVGAVILSPLVLPLGLAFLVMRRIYPKKTFKKVKFL